jgi:hypothetical protein
MENVKQQVLSTILTLPDTSGFDDIMRTIRQLQARFVIQASGSLKKKPVSFLDAANNYLGRLKDSPPDLSTNAQHMEGYGL